MPATAPGRGAGLFVKVVCRNQAMEVIARGPARQRRITWTISPIDSAPASRIQEEDSVTTAGTMVPIHGEAVFACLPSITIATSGPF